MIWADTNILLRLITKTPVHQLEAIKQFLKAAFAPVLVYPVRICEALYVLEGQVYQFSAQQAAQDIAMLLSSDRFEVICSHCPQRVPSQQPRLSRRVDL